jgi:hypothetical protein
MVEDRFLTWCEDEIARLKQTIPLFEAGEIKITSKQVGGWIDMGPKHVERMKGSLAQLERISARLREKRST